MDLEEEFRNLVADMKQKVKDKEDAGDLTADEASALNRMINDRVQIRAWNSSGCYQDSLDYNYDDSVWSPSQSCY